MEYYKVKYIKNKVEEKTFIFTGLFKYLKNQNLNDQNLNELYKTDPSNEIFNDFVNSNDKNVIFVEDLIHMDDSIETIKKKIINTFNLDLEKEVSYDEIYLFSNYLEKIFTSEIYENLTQNGKQALTKEKLYTFLLNIEGFNVDDIIDKQEYTYDDLLDLNLNEKIVKLSQSIGQRFIISEKNYHYVVNPFNVFMLDDFVVKNIEDLLSTNNKNTLLHYKFIEDNTIYLCLAEDVLDYSNENGLEEKAMINIYYPYLREENVKNKQDLDKIKKKLFNNSQKSINEKFKKNNENVNLFYNIFETRSKKILTIEEGIQQLEFIMYPEYNFNLPLDILFKIIQTSESMPIIKYSPSKKQEKIYRLYCDKISKSGKKIPILSKSQLMKYSKNLGLNKKLGCLMILPDNSFISCEFDPNANIYIKIDNRTSKQVVEIENMLKENVNEIIKTINKYLIQSGYNLQLFSSLLDGNIEILNLDYVNYLTINNNFNIKPFIGCLSSVFNVLQDDLKKGIEMRYKRVDNYNKMESMDAFIIDLLNKNTYETNIIEGLIENYQLTQQEAQNKIIDLLNTLQVVQNLNSNKKLKVKNNPGFLTTIKKDDFTNNILIKVSNINNILYLKPLKVYLMGMLQITEKITNIPIDQCKKKYSEETKEKEIIPLNEKQLTENIPFVLETKEISDIMLDEEKTESKSRDILDLLYGDEDEEEDEDDEEDSEEDDGFSGGSPTDENRIEKDITGMDITNPNPFYKKLLNLDPKLYLTKDDGKYNAYARSCPWNKRRQPVILTKQEKENIDKNHPGSYDKFIEYGSDENNKHFYICPRYWDLKRNVSLTKQEVDSGKYGNVIKQGDKFIKKGDNIFEFTDKTDHINKKDGSYKTHYPGFLKDDAHPDDFCVPCCFSEWDKPTQIKRRNNCLIKKDEQSSEKEESTEVDEYIKGPDKFPLAKNRFGYLSVELQMFLDTKNTDCYTSKSNLNLKNNYPCLLRHGIENNEKQSFVAAIADAYSIYSKTKLKNISDFKQYIVDNLTLEKFIKYFNGNLIQLFQEKNTESNQKITQDTILKSNYLIKSFDNFKKFLLDDDITIDYTYLWDLVCDDNEYLFNQGINLVIVEDLQNDLTNNIEIICPSNHYSSTMFKENKDSLILFKKNNFFEPIYLVEKKQTKQKLTFETTPLFSIKKSNENIIQMLLLVKHIYERMCKPLPSIKNIEIFKRNITLQEVEKILTENNLVIEKQIINYYLKVIGIIVKNGDKKGYIPVFPSSINFDIPYNLMDNLENYNDYESTKKFLLDINKLSKNLILSKPVFKLIEDELIIGIITETNQMVPLKNPQQNISDDLKEMKNKSYLEVDKEIFNNDKVDLQRTMYIKKIKLETEFYEIFRTTLRYYLNLYDFKTTRNDIESIINNKTMIYKIKLEKIIELLKKTAEKNIVFVNYDKKMLNTIVKVSQCYKNDLCDKEINCKNENDTCKLLIPKKNLVNDSDNEKIYFGLLSDQLIRYSRIKDFFFQPKIFLSFSNIGFDLTDNEIILLQSILFNEYFDNLIAMKDSTYVKNNVFDNVEPIQSIPYDNQYVFTSNVQKYITKCEIQEKSIFGKNKKIFKKFKEIIFNASNSVCTFDIIITILNDFLGKIYTVNDLKKKLIELYTPFLNNDQLKIFKIYYNYGYKSEFKLLNEKKLTLENFIINQNYYMTNLDIILLSNYFKVPIILLSSTVFFENKKSILLTDKKSTFFYIIKSPSFSDNENPKYKLYVYEGKDLKTYNKNIDSDFEKQIQENEVDEIDYLINESSLGQKTDKKKLGKFKILNK